MTKVLIVDDEKWVRRGIIEKADWKALDAEVVGEARNGLDGFHMAKNLRPDIVITDMRMPVVDGVDFITKLHSELPQVKVIVISGYSDYRYTRHALLNRAVDYILKPIEPAEINKVMSRAILARKNASTDEAGKGQSPGRTKAGRNTGGVREAIRDVMEYIACHYQDKIDLNLISREFNISPTYFCKVFKKETGENFLSYLTRVRMEKARTLIEDYHVRKYEAAYMVGYEDARHFSKLYRKYLTQHAPR